MMKRRMTAVLCLTLLATGALAFSKQSPFGANPFSKQAAEAKTPRPLSNSPNNSSPTQAQPAQSKGEVQPGAVDPVRMPAGSIPEFAVYRQLFHHYAALKAKADDMERHGQSGADVRTFYKRQARLEEKQDRILDKIASEVDAEVAKLDKQAKKIINDDRAKYAGGKIPAGQTPPEPPAELRELAARRTQVILQGKKNLADAFGAPEFARFDQFVQQHIAARMRPVRFDRERPEFPEAPQTDGGPRQNKGQAKK